MSLCIDSSHIILHMVIRHKLTINCNLKMYVIDLLFQLLAVRKKDTSIFQVVQMKGTKRILENLRLAYIGAVLFFTLSKSVIICHKGMQLSMQVSILGNMYWKEFVLIFIVWLAFVVLQIANKFLFLLELAFHSSFF